MDNEDKITKLYMPAILKEYRLKAGVSQLQLADSIGVTKSFISALESGRKFPSIDLLVLIAEVLQVRAGDIINDMVEVADKEKNEKRIY